jgi:uncharacterized protein (DUF927 family)
MRQLDINDLVELIFDEFSNYPFFDGFEELDEEIQEQYKTKLREVIAEWRDEDEPDSSG